MATRKIADPVKVAEHEAARRIIKEEYGDDGEDMLTPSQMDIIAWDFLMDQSSYEILRDCGVVI